MTQQEAYAKADFLDCEVVVNTAGNYLAITPSSWSYWYFMGYEYDGEYYKDHSEARA